MATIDDAPATGGDDLTGGRPAGETSTPDARTPQPPAGAAHTVEAEKRARWEKAAARAAVEQHKAELAAKLGGRSIDDMLSEWQAQQAERERIAEQSATEVQKVSKRAAQAEAARAAAEARITAMETELREHRLERPLRELVSSVAVRKPQYAGVLLAALKSRFALAEDGKTVTALGDDGTPDSELKPDQVLSQVVALYPDLVTTPLPGHGSGPAHPASPGAGPSNGHSPPRLSDQDERAIFGELAKR